MTTTTPVYPRLLVTPAIPPLVRRGPRKRPCPPGHRSTYVVRSYDGDWTERGRGPSLWALRSVLRELLSEARDDMTIAVDRIDERETPWR